MTSAIIGAHNLARIEENLGAADLTLPEEELALLDECPTSPLPRGVSAADRGALI